MPRSLALLVGLLSCAAAFAQEAGTLRDLGQARSFAMGGAYRALGLGTEAVQGNPAAMAMHKNYRVELAGAWDVKRKDAFTSASVMDSSTSALAAGASYHFVKLGRGDEERTAHLNTLGLGFAVSPSVYLGASLRYLVQRGASKANAATPDVGLLLKLTESFAAGISAHNLIDTRHAELPRYYSAHVGLLTRLLTLAADLRADFPKEAPRRYIIGGGAEYIAGEAVPLRAGYSYDALDKTSQVGFGAGIISPGGGLDLAYRQDLGGRGGRLVALTVKLQMQ